MYCHVYRYGTAFNSEEDGLERNAPVTQSFGVAQLKKTLTPQKKTPLIINNIVRLRIRSSSAQLLLSTDGHGRL